jgi:hypothetical protein
MRQGKRSCKSFSPGTRDSDSLSIVLLCVSIDTSVVFLGISKSILRKTAMLELYVIKIVNKIKKLKQEAKRQKQITVDQNKIMTR